MDKARREAKRNLEAWLEKNAALVEDSDERRVYVIAGRQQPFTVVDRQGYVVRFLGTEADR